MDFPIVTVRAEITESFKNMACSKYQPVPLFCFWQAVRDVSSICNRYDTPFMYRWPDQSILLISVEIHDLLTSLNDFFPSRFKKYTSNMIHKTVFQYVTIQKWKIVDFRDYKIILRPPPPLVCKLMQLIKTFLTGNHSEDRRRKGRKDRKLEIWRYY